MNRALSVWYWLWTVFGRLLCLLLRIFLARPPLFNELQGGEMSLGEWWPR